MEPQIEWDIFFIILNFQMCCVGKWREKKIKIPVCKLILSRQKVGDIETAQIIILIGLRRTGKGGWKRSHLAQFGS